MNWTLTKIIFVLFAPAFFMGCSDSDNIETVHSDAVATNEIYALLQVVADGEGYVHAEAQLTRGAPPADVTDATFVKLVDDDELWLSAGPDIESITFTDDIFGGFSDLDESQALFFEAQNASNESYEFLFIRVVSIEDGRWYSARLPVSEEREYRVALFRNTDIGTSARDSVVVLPLAYEITSPAIQTPPLEFSRSTDDILIEWDVIDTSATVELEANTTCLDDAVDSFGVSGLVDDGSLTISSGDLDSELLNGSCSTTLNIRKARLGQLDARFNGGIVQGYEVRSVVITTVD